jgi:hypothetical protein
METVNPQRKRCERAVEAWRDSEAKGSAPKGTGPLFCLETEEPGGKALRKGVKSLRDWRTRPASERCWAFGVALMGA